MFMKPFIPLMTRLIFLAAVCAVFSFQDLPHRPVAGRMPQGGFALVELFTSEGCSSCPAADELLARYAGGTDREIYMLGYHVDYWNYLGWKDPFSRPEYSLRQQQYAASLGLGSIYTPQVIVNGRTAFVGSDERQLKTALQEAYRQGSPTPISIEITMTSGQQARISYRTRLLAGQQIHFALIQRHAVSDVRRGENSGRQLHHLNVVRVFKSSLRPEGSLEFQVPDGISRGDCKIIAFIQDSNTMAVTGAGDMALP